MAIYDLDKTEIIDVIKINWKEYKVWDIPTSIILKIKKIKSWIFWFLWKSIEDQWVPIIKEILEIKNENVNIENISKKQIFWFVSFLKDKILKW